VTAEQDNGLNLPVRYRKALGDVLVKESLYHKNAFSGHVDEVVLNMYTVMPHLKGSVLDRCRVIAICYSS